MAWPPSLRQAAFCGHGKPCPAPRFQGSGYGKAGFLRSRESKGMPSASAGGFGGTSGKPLRRRGQKNIRDHVIPDVLVRFSISGARDQIPA